jgi:hypothetical protein
MEEERLDYPGVAFAVDPGGPAVAVVQQVAVNEMTENVNGKI